jgi:tetratricopeptide (TPR) repeat protein
MNHKKHHIHTCLTSLSKKLSRHVLRKMAGAACLLVLFSFALPVAHADGLKKTEAGKEVLLKQVSELIEADQTNTKNMAKAIDILNTNSALLRDDIRLPLILAQACYLSADPAKDIEKEYPYYEKTGFYARKALDMDPGRTEGHYWYGLFLLKKAQKEGGLSAYFTVKKGIRELELVRKTMPAYDHGGASRVLGLICYIAPGWSPFGDIDKSIRLAEEAKRIDPTYPLNIFYLANAFNKKGDREGAIREYRALLALSSTAGSGKQAALFREKARSMLAALENGTNR